VLPLIFGAGAIGVLLIRTEAVPAALVQPLEVTVTEYVPEDELVAGETEGFCKFELKPAGPVQL
jgi:hypothetical protein